MKYEVIIFSYRGIELAISKDYRYEFMKNNPQARAVASKTLVEDYHFGKIEHGEVKFVPSVPWYRRWI